MRSEVQAELEAAEVELLKMLAAETGAAGDLGSKALASSDPLAADSSSVPSEDVFGDSAPTSSNPVERLKLVLMK